MTRRAWALLAALAAPAAGRKETLASPAVINLTSVAQDVAWPDVELGCALKVDRASQTVRLQTARGGIVTVLGEDAWLTPARPLLCELRLAEPSGTRRAVLAVATDVGYLQHWGPQLWNKLCYCEKVRLDFLLFLGALKSEERSVACAGGSDGSHFSKVVAMHTALYRAGFDEVLVMDADAYFSRPTLDLARPELLGCYFGAMGGASVAAGVCDYQVFVNTAVLLVRRTPWTGALLRTWWRDRCGHKDQITLWHAIFSLWMADEPGLKYAGELMAYAGTHEGYSHARTTTVWEFLERIWPEYLTNYKSSGSSRMKHKFREEEYLTFPNFLLFPRARTRAACGELPPLREDNAGKKAGDAALTGDAAFVYHTKRPLDFDCCPAEGEPRCVDVKA